MENIENIKSKIRKLLALGTSSNKHEAATAIAKAEKLMKLYHLNNSDVAFTQEVIGVEPQNEVIPEWENQLLSACCYPHNCHVVLTESGEAIITGRPQNVEISILMFAYLKDTVSRLAKESEQLKTALAFFLSIKIFEQGKKVSWMDNPNERTAALKYAAAMIGTELVVVPERKKSAEVDRDVVESAGDMASVISLNRQTGSAGQLLQIEGEK
ncbi:hypothetical protein AGMMS4952_11140 [Spirochaetia bacterium]|nr:hypothetical protein AGMMS4952_11140 [Spirochaetia bacterium]